jgi:calcineurin-like phosphoesterase family protein
MFRFGLFADPQYCDCDPSPGRWYRAAVERLAGCIEECNARRVSFVMNLGDLIDRGYAAFEPMLGVAARADAPVYHLTGNHDFEVAPRHKAHVPERLGLRRRFYDFRIDRYRFIALDGTDVSLNTSGKNTRRHRRALRRYRQLRERDAVNAQPWNGGIGHRQLHWLERRLHRAQRRGERVILFCHLPVFPDDRHNLWNAAEVLDTIERHSCVVAYIAGHKHDGDYGFRNGIHHLTLTAMVDTPRESAFALVEVHENSLAVVGYGRQPSRVLPVHG